MQRLTLHPDLGPCYRAELTCSTAPGNAAPNPATTTQAVVTTAADGTEQTTVNCDVRPTKPAVTPELAAAEARKLLPHPTIGAAPRGGSTLVNIETVLWIDTTVGRDLGTVTLLGHRVALRAHVIHVDWSFGDGHTDGTTDPGRAYTDKDPCRTVDCPTYYGHTYRRTGRVDITATITWTGQFQVDGGGWQNIAGTVPAAATTTTITVKQARAVLVPDPGP